MPRPTFKQQIRQLEAQLIADALKQSNGQLSKAARLLGFKHHQSLAHLLEHRHQSLRTSAKRTRRPATQNRGQWWKEAL